MNRRKQRFLPDNHPDWRDPSMPALMTCTDQATNKTYLREFTPNRATYVFSVRMQMDNAPTYQNDPTYNLKRGKHENK